MVWALWAFLADGRGAGSLIVGFSDEFGVGMDVGSDSPSNWYYTDERRCPEAYPMDVEELVKNKLAVVPRTRPRRGIYRADEVVPPALDGPHEYFYLYPPPGTFNLSLYFVDMGGHLPGNRCHDLTVEIRDVALDSEGADSDERTAVQAAFRRAPLLARSRVRGFWSGVYKRFTIRADQAIAICINRNGSDGSVDALQYGIMLDFPEELCPPQHWAPDAWADFMRGVIPSRENLGIHGWRAPDLLAREQMAIPTIAAIAAGWKSDPVPTFGDSAGAAAALSGALQVLPEISMDASAALRPRMAAAVLRSVYPTTAPAGTMEDIYLSRRKATACYTAGMYVPWEEFLRRGGVEPARSMEIVGWKPPERIIMWK